MRMMRMIDVDDGHTNEALTARVQFLQQENNTLTRKNRELITCQFGSVPYYGSPHIAAALPQLSRQLTPKTASEETALNVKEQFMIHMFHDRLDCIVDFQKARSRLSGADRTRAKSGFIGIQSNSMWTHNTGLHAKDNRVKNLVALHKYYSDRGAVVDIPKSLKKIRGRDIEERFCPVCPPGRNEHPSTKCSRAWNTINWLYDLANGISTIVFPTQDAKNTENKNGRLKRPTGP
ncbi:hypothetical protein BJ166DRAFT_614334 [Pestalotiopsis sp. NC0098]|nr:hypothetical protein BJ166DRAFT_614334 [Pestalotiopsis sp. NC0098]